MVRRMLWAVLGAFPLIVVAQPTREDLSNLAKVWASHLTTAIGSKNPEGIPDAVVAEQAFWRLADQQSQGEASFREQLSAKFAGSADDVERISELASQSRSFAASVRAEESKSLDDACTQVVTTEPWQSLDAQAVARRFSQIEVARLQAIEAHYREAIDSLSPSTRAALMSYIDTDIRATITWRTMDNIGLAADVPDAYVWNKRLSCEKWLKRSSAERTWRSESSSMLVDPANGVR